MVSPNLDNQKGAKAQASSVAYFYSDQGIDLDDNPIITWDETNSAYFGSQDVQLNVAQNKLVFKTAGVYQFQFYCEITNDTLHDLDDLEPFGLQLDTSGTNSPNFSNSCNAVTVVWETKLAGRKAVANFFIVADVGDILEPRIENPMATPGRKGNCVLFVSLMGTQNFPTWVQAG